MVDALDSHQRLGKEQVVPRNERAQVAPGQVFREGLEIGRQHSSFLVPETGERNRQKRNENRNNWVGIIS